MFRGFAEMFRGFAEIRGCFAGVSRIHERRFTCFAAVSQQSRIVNMCSRPVALRSAIDKQFHVTLEDGRGFRCAIPNHPSGLLVGWLREFEACELVKVEAGGDWRRDL